MIENSSIYTVLGIDVISYSLRELEDQVHSQEILDRSLSASVEAHWKKGREDVYWIDAGDGGYLLTCGNEHAVLDILQDFQSKIDHETRKWPQDDKLNFRYAIHLDRVKVWTASLGNKFTGHAINNCARLLNGMNKEQEGQVVCSGGYFDAIGAFGNTTVEADQLHDFKDKHGILHKTYNLQRTPGFGVPPLEREINDDPTVR